MAVPTLITDLSTTAALNAPAGSDSPSTLDDIQRAHAAFIAQLRDEKPDVADLSASSGASLIGYLPSGTGSVATTVQDGLRSLGEVVTSITALRAIPKAANKRVLVLGYYADGDGGGGQYHYDSSDVTSSDNGGTVIVGSDSGRWKLAITGSVDFRVFGVKMDDATDNTTALGNLVTYINTSKRSAYCPPGVCRTTGGHALTSGVTIFGDSGSYNAVSRIKLTSDNAALFTIGEGVARVSFRDLELASASTIGTTGISCTGRGSNFPSSYEHHFSNCTLRGFNIAALFESTTAGGGNTAWQIDNIKFDHCLFTENTYGAYLASDNADSIFFDHCKFYWAGASIGVYVARGGFPVFSHCIAGGQGAGTFVLVSGVYEQMLFTQCQAENASYFLNLVGATGNAQVTITMVGCGVDCLVVIGSPAKLITMGCRISQQIALTHAGAIWQSISDQRDTGYSEGISSGYKLSPAGLRKFPSYALGVTQLAIAHGLGYTPTQVQAVAKANSIAWESQAADATNIYLTASVAAAFDIHVG